MGTTRPPWRLIVILAGICVIGIAVGLVLGNLASAMLPSRHPGHATHQSIQ